jgi:hypothetical protein
MHPTGDFRKEEVKAIAQRLGLKFKHDLSLDKLRTGIRQILEQDGLLSYTDGTPFSNQVHDEVSFSVDGFS